VMTATHVLLILAMHQVETASTLLSLALMSMLAQKILAILFKDASTPLNMISKLLDNKTNATLTLAIAWVEILSNLQFSVTTTMLAQLILVMQLLDVSSPLLAAKVSINASHLLVLKQVDNVLSAQFYVMMETNAQLILVMQTVETVFTLLSIATITMHVLLILAMQQVDLAYTSAKSVTIKAFAPSTVATLALEIVSSLTFLLNWLQQNHQINVSLTLAMLLLEFSLLQSLAQQDQLAPQLIAMHQEDVLTMQSLANLLDVQTINAIQLPTNVKSSFQIVMMEMLALLIASIHPLVVSTLLNALLQICAQSQLALQELATATQRTVMMEMFAQLILAIFAPDLVSTL
jgi:hypothetical protein